MKPEPLDRKEGYVDSWQIRDKKDVHPSHRTKVFEAKDIKSACDFFLRYKDNPKLFEKEQFRIGLFYQKFRWYVSDESFGLIEYNEWLFKLAFKDVFKEVEQK